MRHLIATACGAALFLTGASAALAASLAGPPFLITVDDQFIPYSTRVYETSGGDIAAVMAQDARHNRVTESLYIKLFDANGVVKHGKTLVFKASKTADDPAEVIFAGATPLSDGRLMVGYVNKRDDLSGLFARIVTDGQTVGPELAIHTEPADPDPVDNPHTLGGFLLPLTSGGVAIWDYHYWATDVGAEARLVSGSGEISDAGTDVVRQRNFVTEVSKYLDGFIVRYVNHKPHNRRNELVQIFGSDGTRIGPEKRLEQDTKNNLVSKVRALGLIDGSIVVLRKEIEKGDYEITAEVFDKTWAVKKARTVIAVTSLDAEYGAEALPGGDFIVGFTTPDSRGAGDAIEIKRLSQTLQRRGAAIRITGVKAPDVRQLLLRANGDVLMTYTSNAPDNLRKKFSGRFIKP